MDFIVLFYVADVYQQSDERFVNASTAQPSTPAGADGHLRLGPN